jgi:hypothetical protein
LPQLIEATGGIPVDEIVLRTKCELSEAFRDVPSAEDTDEVIKTSKYAWLQNWTVQADLTLQIVDQATLSPGASITQPLHNGYPTNAGPTSIASSGVTTITTLPQSFAVAGGVNLNGQAMRTETMSFVFSVKELGDWRRLPETNRRCALSDNMDLGGRLGLREWVTDAVRPVVDERELLYAGYHPKPTGAPMPKPDAKPTAPTPRVTAFACTFDDVQKRLDDAETTLIESNNTAIEVGKFAVVLPKKQQSAEAAVNKELDKLKKNDRYYAVLDPVVRQTQDGIKTHFDALDQDITKKINLVNEQLKSAEAAGNGLGKRIDGTRDDIEEAIAKNQTDESTCRSFGQRVSDVQTAAEIVKDFVGAAKKNAQSAQASIKEMSDYVVKAVAEFLSKQIEPPIASIGQSVQFILAYGGNVTPTWTFVRFKGPSSPLFAASGTQTHSLVITLGQPGSDISQNQLVLRVNNSLNQVFQ